MTATPIPRTLGQVLYADLDVSDLRTPPAGRVKIRTGVKRPADLDGTWRKVRDEAALGHRTFVVVPLIEEGVDDGDGAVAAESEAVRLSALLDPLRVGMVHGRLKPAERDAEMSRFRDGELDVLVGTTVVEVGVDVPAATMMVIEGADRFGLAQLHQLRGRVGRGTVESFCVLVSDSTDEIAVARLARRRRVERRVRARGEGLRAAQGGRRPRSGAERLPAPPGRVAPGRRASRPGGPGANARRGAARPRRPDGPAAAGPGGRAPGRLAAPRGGRRTGERHVTVRLTPAGSSPGRRAASGSRHRVRAPARWATGSSRRSSRSSTRTCRAPTSWTCSPARARPASRRCHAARRTRRSSSGTRAPRRSSRPTSGGPTWPARAPGSSGPTRWPGWPARSRPPLGPFDVVIVDPPYEEAALMAATLEALGPRLAPGCAGRRQALLARPAAGRRSGC